MCDTSVRPYLYWWKKDSPGLGIPAMDPATAFAVHLVAGWFRIALPGPMREGLDSVSEKAWDVLTRVGAGQYADCFRIVPHGPRRRRPLLNGEVMEGLTQGPTDSTRRRSRGKLRSVRRASTSTRGWPAAAWASGCRSTTSPWSC